jgi:eukaryotic-like serine/threonine-protein kinase
VPRKSEPIMNQDPLLERWDEIDAVFTGAIALEPAERFAFVERRCGGDLELRDAVLSLLKRAVEAEDFLENPGIHVPGSLLDDWRDETEEEEEGPASRKPVGAYRLVREIGRGGTGSVYLAERADGAFEQQVAIKILRRGVDTDDVLARFRAERQILASLNHPNIARLLDGGATDEGRPYLIMELVAGQPITEFCDSRRLTIEERLKIFLVVARAVQDAHRNLIVHRDIKPSNIMVTEDGTVKLLDFGIAKLLDESASEESTPRTRTGYRLMTPDYASPEQVRGEPVTTATDVYQLGLLLYQLLSGRHPFHRSGRTPFALERAIREEEPLPPSCAFALQAETHRPSAHRTSEEIADLRRTEPRRLQSRLRGDLDVIVQMAMRKEPTRRYHSAAALQEDVERHLNARPVAARSDAWGYRTRKLVRRRPGAVAAGLLAMFAAGGYVGTLQAHAQRLEHERNLARGEWQRAEAAQHVAEKAQQMAEEERNRVRFERDRVKSERERAEAAHVLATAERMRAETERDRAEAALRRARVETEKAEQVTKFLIGLFESSDPAQARGEDLTVRQVLDRGLAQADRLPAEPEVRADLLSAMGTVYRSLGLYDSALPLAQEALTLRRQLHDGPHVDVVQSLRFLGRTLDNSGDHRGAEQAFREALAMGRELLGDEDLIIAEVLENLAVTLRSTGAMRERAEALHKAVAIRSGKPNVEPRDFAASLNVLGLTLWQQGDYHGAARVFRAELEILRREVGNDHPDVARSLHMLAAQLMNTDLEGAETVLREAITISQRVMGPEHPSLVASMNNLGIVLRDRRDYEGSERVLQEVLVIQHRALGPEHPQSVPILGNLGRTLRAKGDHDRAERYFEEALALLRSSGGEDHPHVGHTLHELGLVHSARGDLTSAEGLHREALARQTSAFGEESAPVATGMNLLGTVMRKKGDLPGSAELHRSALAIARKEAGGKNATVARSLLELGLVLQAQGDFEGAELSLREGLQIFRELMPEDFSPVAEARKHLSDLLSAKGNHAAAAALQ